MHPAAIFLACVGLAVCIRLFVGVWDKDRIRQDLTARGCKGIQVRWSRFGPGWFGEKSDRIYHVTYRAPDGAPREAYCKTGLFTGIYWTPPGDIAVPRPSCDADGLRAENEALRAEVERLRRERGRL